MSMPASTMALRGISLPPRSWKLEVITATAPASMMRSFSALAEKPPNTTLWVAPMRAQACIAMTPSMVIGM